MVATSEKAKLAGPARPLGSPEIPQFHLPARVKDGIYTPRLYGAARIQFGDRRRKIDQTRHVAFLVGLEPGAKVVDWETAQPTDVMPDQLLKDPAVVANYAPLAAGAMQIQTFTRWAKNFDRWLARTQRLEIALKGETTESSTIGPKRGGVSVDLVAVVWELT
jgi:hypothetical protein